MVKNLLAALGWSKRQWILFLLAFDAFIVILPIESAIGFNLNNALLWLTGIVILAYTVETQGLRLEMVRQNEIAIQPLLIARIERRQWRGEKYKNSVILQNIGRGPALFIQFKDVLLNELALGRFVGEFATVDCIEAGKDAIADASWRFEGDGEEPSQPRDFVPNLNPQTADQSYDVTITYEDINGQKRESVVRMGKGGIRLLKQGK